MAENQGGTLTHREAKRIATEYLRGEGSTLVATHATRNNRFGIWIVGYRDPTHPDEQLDGGGLVVTDQGEVHELGSAPGSLDDLMLTLNRWPGAEPVEMFGSDAEALALLADEDPQEASDLAVWAAARRPWTGVLDDETSKPYFRDLMRYVDNERVKHGHEVYPAPGDVFAAFHLTPYERVKVVILGQDPYPNPREAMGLAFSVPRGTPKPTSMINIHAALRADGFTPPEHGDLTAWAHQGVFLLNAALTVPRNGEKQHLKAWRPFTDAVIKRISVGSERPVVFVLWGVEAQKARKRGLINESRHGVVAAPHPAARNEHQKRFRAERTFLKVNQMLHDFQSQPIDWEIK